MINIIICSKDRQLFQGEVESVYVPAKEGEFQILSGHAPILALLDKGMIRLQLGREEKSFPVEAGIIEAHKDRVSLLIK